MENEEPLFPAQSKLLFPIPQILWRYQVMQKLSAACHCVKIMLTIIELIPQFPEHKSYKE